MCASTAQRCHSKSDVVSLYLLGQKGDSPLGCVAASPEETCERESPEKASVIASALLRMVRATLMLSSNNFKGRVHVCSLVKTLWNRPGSGGALGRQRQGDLYEFRPAWSTECAQGQAPKLQRNPVSKNQTNKQTKSMK